MLWLVGSLAACGRVECKIGKCRNGLSIQNQAKGFYAGTFAKGLRTGEAVMTLEDGSRYAGEVRNGKPHGIGILFRPDGSTRAGMFENGRLAGPGVIEYGESGESSRYYGEIQDGEPSGYGLMFRKDGTRRAGRWKGQKGPSEYGYIQEGDQGFYMGALEEEGRMSGWGTRKQGGSWSTGLWEGGKLVESSP